MDEALTQNISDRVELVWPNKHTVARVFQEPDGRWNTETKRHRASLRGLSKLSFVPDNRVYASSLLLTGQRHDSLSMLRRAIGPVFRLIYIDLPRLNVDDATNAFQSSSPLRLTTWLSLVRMLLSEARELLNRTGVVAVHCGEDEAQYAKLLVDEYFRDKRVGTVVWQKSYSGQNMRGMKEFTDTHDLIYLYARDKDALPPVGLRKLPEGYANPDGDPRGAWRAEHKGAKTRRENSDFDTYQPPYRWKIISGELPPGLWRLSPFIGVIWGTPAAVGEFEFVVEVTDQAGSTATAVFSLTVKDSGAPVPPPDIPWIFDEIVPHGNLKIGTKTLPSAVVGEVYSAVLLGEGGNPFRGPAIRPGSGRYWDFAKATLVAAYQHDAVYMGSRQPTSIPTPKKYEPPAGVLEIENQQSLWPGRSRETGSKTPEAFAGFTEDATKHLKALRELGIIESEVATAKPEKLLARLLEIFTDKGDLVLEVMSSTADLAAVALKAGRRFVALQGCAPRDLGLMASCALPRLKAVVAGEDQGLEERAPAIKLSQGAYIPFGGGGGFVTAELGPELAVLATDDDYPVLTEAVATMSEDELLEAVLTAEGYLPHASGGRFAIAIDGHARAIFVPPTQFLTPELASRIASETEERGDGHPTTIYFFRSTEDIDEKLFGGRILLRRVPFDLLRLDVA